MRILITGFIVLVIWSFLSMWLYVDILKPQTRKPVVIEQPKPDPLQQEADSLAKFYASMPKLMLYFDFDKTKIIEPSDIDSKVAEFKSWLGKYPASMITVTGHTDFIGTPDYNNDLGLKRAEIVKKYLEGKGIPADKMITSSVGKDQPVAGYVTSYNRDKNRRTEVTIKK